MQKQTIYTHKGDTMSDTAVQVPVSRAEFDAHRREVSRDIENLGKAIVDGLREEAHLRSQDTTNVRSDISKLTDNVNRLATNTGRPQYQFLGFAFGVFSFVIVLVSGLYTYMDGQLRDKDSELSHERAHSQTEMILELKDRGERWDNKFDQLFTINHLKDNDK